MFGEDVPAWHPWDRGRRERTGHDHEGGLGGDQTLVALKAEGEGTTDVGGLGEGPHDVERLRGPGEGACWGTDELKGEMRIELKRGLLTTIIRGRFLMQGGGTLVTMLWAWAAREKARAVDKGVTWKMRCRHS